VIFHKKQPANYFFAQNFKNENFFDAKKVIFMKNLSLNLKKFDFFFVFLKNSGGFQTILRKMSFLTHTFETNPESDGRSFVFHETISEGKDVYFLGKFSDETTDPKSAAEAIFGAIISSFDASESSDSYDQFEDALKSANLKAREILDGKTPSILVAFFDFQNLFLSQSGESEAYLVRGDIVSQISETTDDHNDIFQNILSGEVVVGDAVILASDRILRAVTANQIADIFARDDFNDAVRALRHELATNTDSDIVATVIGVGKKERADRAGFFSRAMRAVAERKPAQIADPPPEEAEKPEQPKNKTSEEVVADDRPRNFKFSIPTPDFSKLLPKKNLLIVAGAIFAVFLLGIFARAIMNFESAETQELREKLTIAQEAISQADTFWLQGERKSASEFLQKAEKEVQAVLNSESKNFRSEAQFWLKSIQEKKLQVENARKITPQLLADLGVKNDNLEAVGLLAMKNNLFAYDLKNVHKTVRNIVEKALPIVEKESILAGSARSDQNTLIFLTDSPRLIEYREGLVTPMNTADESWKHGIDIATYGRYAYLLDPVENQIWKYERRRAKYSPAIAYNQGADLSRAVSFAIDGSIFVLSDDGTIQKILRGTKEKFAFRDLPSISFQGKNLKLFTSKELDFLYILDPDNSRILVFVKGDQFATYKKQILFDIEDARDFWVDDSGLRGNILTKDKIYEFSF